ncbi:hypothetical protein FV232_05165 [Methylobacterium sp. WL30]|uniref:hypothetical protein n=1 Tax=unclassified Methylobacterium TaxID=2615210 RepID=UPI0011C76E97|nr:MULTISPECIES: hypothetical protein [unclassified Methylobacterium]TXN40497.1 hypothetical protein FV225_05995 [Methylobacterium sp. WL93]TXN52294.1 hypothetical protein FV227_04380 [Methylobacterium sp. WL119]TXN69673.1 hypothetical protein FV232_05165 [Methylobacterium sp. WL30]
MIARNARRIQVIWRRLRGWRTFIFFTPAFLVTLLDALHAIDFRQLLLDMGAPEGTAKAIVAGCFLVGIVLRAYTTTPPMRPQGGPDAGGPR